MCGINGVFHKKSNINSSIETTIDKMNNSIVHRGPDEHGVFIECNDDYVLGMGMQRLSIIDLNSGKQPIFNDDKSIVIVFNGEIYNYKLLKKELLNEGVLFKTSSDTEVILRLYEKHGVSAFKMLDGMFSFSIYDKNLDKIYLTRDYFGEKPCYYYKTEDSFYWASELKSILNVLNFKPKLSSQAISIYFQLTYIPAPYTIYENIYKLEPNNYIELDCSNLQISIHKIGELFDTPKYDKLSFSEAKEITHNLVQESVKSRSVSDVAIGTFLSGGVDSSIVSLCLAKDSEIPIETFSIGFDKKSFDETDKSQVVAKLIKSNHHEFVISENGLKYDVNEVILNFDEPFADSSALPTYLVSKKTKDFVKVALTGDGGDEVFGGYNKYYMGRLNQNYTKYIPEKLHVNSADFIKKFLINRDDKRGIKFKLNRFLNSINYKGNFYYNIVSLAFQEDELQKMFKSKFYEKDSLGYYKAKIGNKNRTLTDFRNIDRLLSLEGDLLVKVDRTSMLSSLECRAPFLNKELWNFTSQVPESFLIKGWDKKHLLKESFKSYFPKDFLNKSKKGFGVPVGDWLRTSFKDELLSYIEITFLSKQNIFNVEYMRNLVLNHLESKIDNTFRVWSFYCFQKWYVNIYNDAKIEI